MTLNAHDREAIQYIGSGQKQKQIFELGKHTEMVSALTYFSVETDPYHMDRHRL